MSLLVNLIDESVPFVTSNSRKAPSSQPEGKTPFKSAAGGGTKIVPPPHNPATGGFVLILMCAKLVDPVTFKPKLLKT